MSNLFIDQLLIYKGRTFRKVRGDGWGIFEPQEVFFRYQIPSMNFFLGRSMNIF